jgi:hypothetical protein
MTFDLVQRTKRFGIGRKRVHPAALDIGAKLNDSLVETLPLP